MAAFGVAALTGSLPRMLKLHNDTFVDSQEGDDAERQEREQPLQVLKKISGRL